MSIKNLVEMIKRNGLLASMPQLEKLYEVAIENEQKLAESEARCAALAAENAGVKNIQAWAVADVFKAGATRFESTKAAGFDTDDCLHDAVLVMLSELKAPATDAFLAEVRASSITDALKSLDVVFDTDCVIETNGISYEDAEQRTAGAYAVSKALEEFAAQLRKGVQS